MESIEEKVDRLQDDVQVLKEWAQRVDKVVDALLYSIYEMKELVEKDRQKAEKDRQAWQEEMRRREEKAEKDRQAWQEEMRRREEKAEKDRQAWQEESKREWREYRKEMGKIAKKLGKIVEDIVFPATRPVLEKYFKCEITTLAMNVRRRVGGIEGEFDIIAMSEPCKSVYLIEVKSTPRPENIGELIDKVANFKKLFPEYQDYKLIPIFASLNIEDSLINALSNKNIYAMAYREWDYMDILNFDKVNKDLNF